MLSTFRDNEGRILGCIECRVVNDRGLMDPEGEYVWVEQIELNPGVDSNFIIRCFMDEFGTRCPRALWTYWIRRDKTGTRIHGPYTREQVMSFIERGEVAR